MDNINEIVECIHLSTSGNARKAYATQVLDQIRLSAERYNIGLRLFVEAKDHTAKFFGLSLIRDWMQTDLIKYLFDDRYFAEFKMIRENIRNVIYTWMINLLSDLSNLPSIPFYLTSNAISVLALSIKFDFPSLWPTAFHDVLNLGYMHGIYGIEIVTRVLKELEIEVVMFNENRTKEEIMQNVIVKDSMRESPIVKDIVQFLCKSAQHTYLENKVELCIACLQCLAELIGWIDVNIVIENALSVIYQLWQHQMIHPAIRAEACACLCELVKKGMDPILKVKLIQTIELVDIVSNDMKTRELLSNHILHDEDEINCLSMLGQLLSILTTEYIGCWCKYEEYLVGLLKNKDFSIESNINELLEVIPVVVPSLHSLLPKLLQLFNMHHSLRTVVSSVLPACNRFVTLLKFQQQRDTAVVYLSEQCYQQQQGISFFHAQQYFSDLLRGIYVQSHFPNDFDFIEDGEDELNEDVQLKAEVRKLFVNCCRIDPERCLEMITAVMHAQPQPISTAPYPSLEAALGLVYAYSELGPGQMKSISERSSFPSLIKALQQTDIVFHNHPQVILLYFEISLRYLKYLGSSDVMNLMTSLLSKQGVLNKNFSICNRAAYCVLKVSEGMQQCNVPELARHIYPQLSDILLQASSIRMNSLFTKPPLLSEQSELYLCEAIAFITSSTTFSSSNHPTEDTYLLGDFIAIQTNQIQIALNLYDHQPHLQEQLCIEITQRINALCGLTKGYNYKTHENKIEYFENATKVIVLIVKQLCAKHSSLRAKVLFFLHRMVHCMGKRIIIYDQEIIPILLQIHQAQDSFKTTTIITDTNNEIIATPNEVIQIINQLMMEFGSDCEQAVDFLFSLIINKYRSLSAVLESTVANNTGFNLEAPHIQAERLALHHQYLLFIQHIVCYQCLSVLYSQRNVHELDGMFAVILSGLSGGFVACNTQESVPVRKTSLIILHNLVLCWLLPKSYLNNSTTSSRSTSYYDIVVVPNQIKSAFRSYLYENAIPTAFHTISSNITIISSNRSSSEQINKREDFRQINVNDAATQSILIELSVLFRYSFLELEYSSSNDDNNQSGYIYYENLCNNLLHWPIEVIKSLLVLMVQENTTPLGTFKETFKKFIRNNSISNTT